MKRELHLGVALIAWGRQPVRRERPVLDRETVETRRSLDRLRGEYQPWGADLTRLKYVAALGSVPKQLLPALTPLA